MLNFGSLQAKKRARSSRADLRIVTNVSGETTDIPILLHTCITNLIDVCIYFCAYIPMYEYYRNYFNRKNKFNIKKKLAVSWISYILKYSILLDCVNGSDFLFIVCYISDGVGEQKLGLGRVRGLYFRVRSGSGSTFRDGPPSISGFYS